MDKSNNFTKSRSFDKPVIAPALSEDDCFDWSLIEEIDPSSLCTSAGLKSMRKIASQFTRARSLPLGNKRLVLKLLQVLQVIIGYNIATNDEFLVDNTKSNSSSKNKLVIGVQCPICQKLFKSIYFVDKHIAKSHSEYFKLWQKLRTPLNSRKENVSRYDEQIYELNTNKSLSGSQPSYFISPQETSSIDGQRQKRPNIDKPKGPRSIPPIKPFIPPLSLQEIPEGMPISNPNEIKENSYVSKSQRNSMPINSGMYIPPQSSSPIEGEGSRNSVRRHQRVSSFSNSQFKDAMRNESMIPSPPEKSQNPISQDQIKPRKPSDQPPIVKRTIPIPSNGTHELRRPNSLRDINRNFIIMPPPQPLNADLSGTVEMGSISSPTQQSGIGILMRNDFLSSTNSTPQKITNTASTARSPFSFVETDNDDDDEDDDSDPNEIEICVSTARSFSGTKPLIENKPQKLTPPHDFEQQIYAPRLTNYQPSPKQNENQNQNETKGRIKKRRKIPKTVNSETTNISNEKDDDSPSSADAEELICSPVSVKTKVTKIENATFDPFGSVSSFDSEFCGNEIDFNPRSRKEPVDLEPKQRKKKRKKIND